ncbi:MAG TPA: glycoside hydrolase family 3 N-terminal domain-containing protein, partial [Longimicrobiales bacterium]
PLLVTSNMESGPGERLAGVYSLPYLQAQGGGVRFPPAMALGAAGSDTLAFEQGRVTAEEARAVGVHMTFAPDLDVNSNPANPIINTRSFGEAPALVARLGNAFIRGARAGGLLTTGKHFPGHGDTRTDSHIDLPTIPGDRARLDAVELAPFRAAVTEGVDAIMTAHIAVLGVEGPQAPPATLSPYFLTRVLREEMSFHGLVITDAMEMGAVTKHYGDVEAVVRAVQAGADIVLKPLDVTRALDGLEQAARSGRIAPERIDASVRRILEAKARAGLDRSPAGQRAGIVPLDSVDRHVGTRAHQALAEEVARRSITLVRDQAGAVPLRAGARLLSLTYARPADLVAGRELERELAARRPATPSADGSSAPSGRGHQLVSVRADERTDASQWAALAARGDSVDVVVVSAYVTPRESAGSVGMSGGLARFLGDVAARGKPVILVSFGSPYLLAEVPDVPAYLLAWGPYEVSQRAAARALLGLEPITGRLPISIPPLYHVGDGLTRTTQAAR